MQPTVGIICEYDPFHRGHARQFALARQALPNARIVCVMSGCFTQRGMPALFSPAFRARAALNAGADVVLELPAAFAVREAENFALGGVALLNALPGVTHLSFGCETDCLPFLEAAAAQLEKPNKRFTEALRAALALGRPYAAAQAEAVAAGLCADGFGIPAPGESQAPADPAAFCTALAQPNNILAICYLRALRRLGSAILPLPVRREGAYHAAILSATDYPSASATRKAFLAGDTEAAEAACGYSLASAPRHLPDALDPVLLHCLRSMNLTALRALPDCAEGLENRLTRAAREAVTRKALLEALKTKRYAYARLNRLATHALLGVTACLLREHPLPEYARLLGFRRDAQTMLPGLGQSALPVIAKAADGNRENALYALDNRAYDLWALGAGLPAGFMYREPVAVVGAPPLP
ncbi:MAG TPA: nucleotidyltransferase family protein [Candidatus Limiplasma sp.]|nr:nucleotidyltransferase family protein [Candidatus Limiplasma sp.]HPS82214.1 nucleotidyltransferase family protein [Candidatus Limiplasma sp.]